MQSYHEEKSATALLKNRMIIPVHSSGHSSGPSASGPVMIGGSVSKKTRSRYNKKLSPESQSLWDFRHQNHRNTVPATRAGLKSREKSGSGEEMKWFWVIIINGEKEVFLLFLCKWNYLNLWKGKKQNEHAYIVSHIFVEV